MLDDLFGLDDIGVIELRYDLELFVGELLEVLRIFHLLYCHDLVGESVPGLVHVGEVPTTCLG